MKKIDLLVFLFIIFASIYTLKDLFKPNFYTSHDGVHQVVRLYYWDQLIRDGQIPPRFVTGLLNGFGYPLFIFSYHFPWFIAQPMLYFGFSIFQSIKMTFLIGFILSGVTMYLFQKEMFNPFAAFTGTIIYLYAPFRFSNIFVRAAIGDATIFIFPPLLFLSFRKLLDKNTINLNWLVLGAFSITAMLLSHAMVSVFYFFCFGLFFIFRFIFEKKKWLLVRSFVFMIILSVGLSSYYLFPSLIERKLTKFSDTINLLYLGQNFLKLDKLIYSPWGYGTVHSAQGAMSLQIGAAQLLSVIFFCIALIALILPKKKEKYSFGIFFLAIFFISIFLMLKESKFIWSSIKNIIIIDFPWRILSLTVFSSSLIAGSLIYLLKKRKLAIMLSFILVGLSFYSNRNYLRINQILDWPLSFYINLEKTTNSYDEYTPKWVTNDVVAEPKEKISVSSPQTMIKILENKSNLLKFEIDAWQEGNIKINTIYYPGFELLRNGKKQDFDYQNTGGVIEFNHQKGKQEIELIFRETLLRNLANIITAISVIISLLLLLMHFRLNHQKRH